MKWRHHGHIDHVAGLPHHAAKRSLYSMSKAQYHVPTHLMEQMKSVAEGYKVMAETTEVLGQLNIIPLDDNATVWLPNGHLVKAFPTVHRVKSQGYLVYKEHKKLKPKFVGKPGHELAVLNKQGVDIHDITTVPELAYTGDTMMDLFLNPPTPDLLNVKVLITEATYIDNEPGKDMIQLARKRGHQHLAEIVQNADLFKNIQHIVLMHFSDKYSTEYIRTLTSVQLPPSLREKVLLATWAKERS
ncbi:tRNase Z TRZ1-like isoform X2 [Gigantopelta aegis]|uniref:tRNase Z TRZ1-like isoform X2 n=1 Tax=Gigantopelta aegis TaxID=1735272 RepID=UPI001B888768|nr:tRNase Z TRZ1-like isoform X2 [Gigantopelta aegis]